jgi:hypothetical protein
MSTFKEKTEEKYKQSKEGREGRSKGGVEE